MAKCGFKIRNCICLLDLILNYSFFCYQAVVNLSVNNFFDGQI